VRSALREFGALFDQSVEPLRRLGGIGVVPESFVLSGQSIPLEVKLRALRRALLILQHEREQAALKSPSNALELLKQTVIAVIRHALVEPQLVADLRNC